MLAIAFSAALWLGQVPVPPVPGQCAEPAARHQNEPGCYLTGELRIEAAPSKVYWHIRSFPDLAAARRAGIGHEWHLVAQSHGKTWLYVLARSGTRLRGGRTHAIIGPLRLPRGRPVVARFIESVFTAGMRTRVHAHPGAEAFYVVEGVQCMETPMKVERISAGGTYVVPGGPHVQASPLGRRNLAVVFHSPDEPWMRVTDEWTDSGACTS